MNVNSFTRIRLVRECAISIVLIWAIVSLTRAAVFVMEHKEPDYVIQSMTINPSPDHTATQIIKQLLDHIRDIKQRKQGLPSWQE